MGWLGQPDAESFVRARSLLPLAGAIIGTAGAGVMGVVFQLVADSTVAALAGLLATIALTGAMHEDGFADVCDGLGGGSERERVLAIMRDSRLGSFGVLGLLVSCSLRVRMLALMLERESLSTAALTLVASHVMARSASVVAMDRFPYARQNDTSANGSVVDRPFEPKERALYTVPALVAAVLATHGPTMPVLLCAATLAVAVIAGTLFDRWLSGVTGDCLGAIEQLAEIAVLFVACVGTLR